MDTLYYEGIIEITRIENQGQSMDEIGTLTATFVRYPGSQQLSVHLPESVYNGYGYCKIIEIRKNHTVEENQVSDIISGTKKLLFDSIVIAPGEYVLEIEHPKGGKHMLYFNKLEENEKVPIAKIIQMPMAAKDRPSLYIEPKPIVDNMDWR